MVNIYNCNSLPAHVTDYRFTSHASLHFKFAKNSWKLRTRVGGNSRTVPSFHGRPSKTGTFYRLFLIPQVYMSLQWFLCANIYRKIGWIDHNVVHSTVNENILGITKSYLRDLIRFDYSVPPHENIAAEQILNLKTWVYH